MADGEVGREAEQGIVDRFTLAGVTVVWSTTGGSYRGIDRIALSRRGEVLNELGPFSRTDAKAAFDAVHSALRAAATVQLQDLRRASQPGRRAG
jgi:hypothetical protein